MDVTDADIHALVQEIWRSYLDLDVDPGPVAEPEGPTLSGIIHIHGAWEGTVILRASQELATHAAEAMFGTEELDDGDIDDALGEIVNMLGGSVKALADGPCSLSLPTVIGGRSYTLAVPGSSDLLGVWMASAGHPVHVRVLQRATADVGVLI